MKNEPNRAPAKEAAASGQCSGAIAHGEKWGDPAREYSTTVGDPPAGLSSADPQVLPITDRIWAANHRLAENREAAAYVGAKNHKRAALALHELAQGLMDLRDEFDKAGWNQESRWTNQAALALNLAARFAWKRGAE
jgi:hypothetical protein